MPDHLRRHAPRGAALLAGAIAAAAIAASLTGCAGQDGAAAAAERYVDLVATADADDLESLWAMSAAAPIDARIAGDLLVGATERIEVLDVGAPSEAPTTSGDSATSDVTAGEAVQVPVRYELGGDEHAATIVLAPLRDHPQTDPASWRVVTPLLGDVQLPPTAFAYVGAPDVVVGGTVLGVDRLNSGPASLFPAIYDVRLTAEPYLESAIEPLTVLAGSTVSVANLPLEPTEATSAWLQEASDERFTLCAAELSECPFDIVDEAEWTTTAAGWDAELTAAPTVTVDGTSLELTGGALTVQSQDGPATLSFSGTGTWAMDNQSFTPGLLWTRFELVVTR